MYPARFFIVIFTVIWYKYKPRIFNCSTVFPPFVRKPGINQLERKDRGLSDSKRHEKDIYMDIEEFEREREELKKVLGKIGGNRFSKKDNLINLIFFLVIIGLFLLDLFTEIMPWRISLELGIFLVSFKIVFMIHSQQKVNHFQFWILNSIEFRMNDMSRRLRSIEKRLEEE